MNDEHVLLAGGIELRIQYRDFGDDGGPAVRVFGSGNGAAVHLLRFDCFRRDPHYHYDPSGTDGLRKLDKEEVPDPIAWTLEQLRSHLEEMIRTAGYDSAAAEVDQAAVAAVLPEVESIMRG